MTDDTDRADLDAANARLEKADELMDEEYELNAELRKKLDRVDELNKEAADFLDVELDQLTEYQHE